jgi:DNA-binding CsgD family transcriptional regulator
MVRPFFVKMLDRASTRSPPRAKITVVIPGALRAGFRTGAADIDHFARDNHDVGKVKQMLAISRDEYRRARSGPVEPQTLMECVTIRRSEDIREAARTIRDFAAEHDLRAALCDDIASNEAIVDDQGSVLAADLFGWQAEGERWWEDRCLALHSPLPRACRYENEPFWCSARGFFTVSPNPYLQEIDPRRYFAGQPGFKAAIVIPVHLPFAQISANSFIHVDPEIEDLSDIFAAIGGTLSAITRRFITGYVAAMRTKRRLPSDCELSKREVECLRWAAIGKTDGEIATIVELSHATIRYHLNRASGKLNAINRTQTIFKAGQLGFLGASA